MDGATTSVDDHMTNLSHSDDTSLSLPLHVPMGVQTYYETICKIQPLARKNLIISDLEIRTGTDSQGKYDFVVADIKHLRGHDISDRLECLVIERSLYSPIGSSSSAKHIVSQCRRECFYSGGHRWVISKPQDRRFTFDKSSGGYRWDSWESSKSQEINFDTSSDSDVRNLCLLDELFRLVTIISNNSHLYSTDIDAPYWFAATIMETVQAIFPPDPADNVNNNEGWFNRTFRRPKLPKPQSECSRRIVAAYKADKKKHPNPTPSLQSNSHGSQSNAAPGNESEEV